jgi:hypothetical protein
MRVIAGIAVTVMLSGCATRHARVPAPPDRTASNDWAAVLAIRPDTYVFAVLDDNHFGYGPLERATDTTLTIRGLPAIPRATVVRVETAGPITRNDALYGFPIGTGTLVGFAGIFIGVAVESTKVKGWSAAVLGASMIAGFVYMARHHPVRYADAGTRVVYVRR